MDKIRKIERLIEKKFRLNTIIKQIEISDTIIFGYNYQYKDAFNIGFSNDFIGDEQAKKICIDFRNELIEYYQKELDSVIQDIYLNLR